MSYSAVGRVKYYRHYHSMQLQSAAVFTVVGVLAVGQVFGHETQGSGGKRSTDEVQHQDTFHLQVTL